MCWSFACFYLVVLDLLWGGMDDRLPRSSTVRHVFPVGVQVCDTGLLLLHKTPCAPSLCTLLTIRRVRPASHQHAVCCVCRLAMHQCTLLFAFAFLVRAALGGWCPSFTNHRATPLLQVFYRPARRPRAQPSACAHGYVAWCIHPYVVWVPSVCRPRDCSLPYHFLLCTTVAAVPTCHYACVCVIPSPPHLCPRAVGVSLLRNIFLFFPAFWLS